MGRGPLVTAPNFCPRCNTTKPVGTTILTLTHAVRGTVFVGCPDCLIKELDELAQFKSDPCNVCGATKVMTRFSGQAERPECPVHVHARPLLGRALVAFRALGANNPAVNVLCMDLVDALGVEEKT